MILCHSKPTPQARSVPESRSSHVSRTSSVDDRREIAFHGWSSLVLDLCIRNEKRKKSFLFSPFFPLKPAPRRSSPWIISFFELFSPFADPPVSFDNKRCVIGPPIPTSHRTFLIPNALLRTPPSRISYEQIGSVHLTLIPKSQPTWVKKGKGFARLRPLPRSFPLHYSNGIRVAAKCRIFLTNRGHLNLDVHSRLHTRRSFFTTRVSYTPL